MRQWIAFAFVFLLAAGCGTSDRRSETSTPAPFRVALLLTGPISDDGWNASAYEGLQVIRDQMGAEVSYVESLEKSQFEENFRQYASQGYRLILGHGYEFGDAAMRVAEAFPKTTFVVIAGNKSAVNVASVNFRLEEATYELGVLSAMMSRTGVAGLVGGEEIPSLAPGFDAFVIGAHSVKPGFRVITKYVGNWSDVTLAKEHASALIAQGADIIFQNADKAGLGVFQAVEEHPGTYAFGSNKDQNGLAPAVILGSAVIDVPKALLHVARQVNAGTFVHVVQGLGIRDGIVFVKYNDLLVSHIALETRKKLIEVQRDIRQGKLQVLAGAAPAEER